MKSRRMKWVGHVARMRKMSIFWLEVLNRRDPSEDLVVDGRIILECTIRK
jgi:hypothetical protein